MSSALLRRSSSKLGLQQLMRLTAQRSVEDAEEVEREQRRRRREETQWSNGGSPPGESSSEDGTYDLKPSSSVALEEDEGFSDWTQRRERRRQQRLQELSQGGEEDEEEDTVNKGVPGKSVQDSVSPSGRLHRQDRLKEDVTGVEMERRKEREEMARRDEEREEEEDKRMREEAVNRRKEEIQRPNTEVEKRSEVKVFYTSKVFLHQEPKQSDANGDAATKEVTSSKSNRKKSRAVEPEQAEAVQEAEQPRLRQEEAEQEAEQPRHRQEEAEQELEELKRRREERRQVRLGDEHRRKEEEQRLAREEEERRSMKDMERRSMKEDMERRSMKEDMERKRMEAAERMKSLSTSSVNGDEVLSPFSPKTHKISERTGSLNRSLKKSNSFKKTQTLVLLPKIDNKLEQYTHAVENSQEVRAVKASRTDRPSPPEAEARSRSTGGGNKDAEGLTVGVANRITQWVKGPADGSRASPGRATEVRPGDVMQKKNMWEVIGDSTGKQSPRAKGSAAGKKYKFVVTGHGKYEKIPTDGENGGEFTDGVSDLYADDL
ncbi:non-muscle caldesmon isoform X2 [Pseudoliparis swirei]|uniref:non-muscle caldesmon isoform X2 n=1 Tax=Pseudoliparis swirei TaxID=2059687 RepID=UPI0024BE717D|nr:non-muscle caldesmon isoform X2 [Pseudoliparis swirei]